MRLAALALLLVTLSACSAEPGTPTPAPGMPDDFVGVISYSTGSLPPPYHYTWEVRFDEDSAEVEWQPGYDEAVPPFRASTPLDRDQREQAYERLRAAGQFDPLPTSADDDQLAGGSTAQVELTAGGRTYAPGTVGTVEETKDMVDAVQEAAEGLFPAEVWESLVAQQEAWEEQHPR